MLEAARAGQIDVIVAYSNSRLTRRLMELQALIELHDKHGVEIHTVVSGSDNLATADGRMIANIKASVDQAEAERTGERLRRAFLAKAQKGSVNQGVRPFGWKNDEENDKENDKKALHRKESQALRETIQDVIDGVPLREQVLSTRASTRVQGIRASTTTCAGDPAQPAPGRPARRPGPRGSSLGRWSPGATSWHETPTVRWSVASGRRWLTTTPSTRCRLPWPVARRVAVEGRRSTSSRRSCAVAGSRCMAHKASGTPTTSAVHRPKATR